MYMEIARTQSDIWKILTKRNILNSRPQRRIFDHLREQRHPLPTHETFAKNLKESLAQFSREQDVSQLTFTIGIKVEETFLDLQVGKVQ